MKPAVLLLTEEQGHGGINTMVKLLSQALCSHGWQVQQVNVRHARPPFLQLFSLARQAQVVVASNNFLPAYWAVLLGLLTQRPSVVWVHGPLAEVLRQEPVSWCKRLLMRWTCQMTDLLVFASRASQDGLHRVIAPRPLPAQTVIHNPAPSPAAACAAILRAGPPRTGVALGFVGRLSHEKRPTLLLHMLKDLPNDHHLTLVGDGPMRQELEALAYKLGLMGSPTQPSRVTFAGAQQVDLFTYRAWHATVLCSAYEGYPMVALESLAAGVPCIGTPLPALQEMLGPQAKHWLSPDNSAESLASKVLEALALAPARLQQQALAVTQHHDFKGFSQSWYAQLMRCTRQAWPGIKTVHFVHSGPAYMPELSAYEAYLAEMGHRSVRHSDPATVPLDADVVWWICGRVSAQHSHRLRRSLQVHEYASTSVGRWPLLKDRIKRWRHPVPDHRVFLNAWVRSRMGFEDSVPSSLRDMGVPPAFLQAAPSRPVDHDLVYLGEMSRLRYFLPALQAISQAGLKLLLIGQPPADLEGFIRLMPGVTCTGRIAQSQVPEELLRARAGLNLMPDRLPLAMQTATKVLEYLAVGLPVLSNDYPWARAQTAQYPERIRLLHDLRLPEVWAESMAWVPKRATNRSDLDGLAWPNQVATIPVWKQLGLTRISPP